MESGLDSDLDSNLDSDLDSLLARFMAERSLPDSYQSQVRRWLAPLSEQLSDRCRGNQGPLLVGVSGCQGSGKSTFAAALALLLEAQGLRVAVLSLDDFYLPRAERARRANAQHPLFATRGVPGTHDLALAMATLNRLCTASSSNEPSCDHSYEDKKGEIQAGLNGEENAASVLLPRFDKASDEPAPQRDWPRVDRRVEVVLFEGWCLAAQPLPRTHPDLAAPCNELERVEDPDGSWRRRVNDYLAEYQALFATIDFLILLQAPSFDCVLPWRLKQERMLQKSAAGIGVMDETALVRFVQHFERLTRHCLAALPDQADVVFELDTEQQITGRREA